ncbi:MAG: hypothetical protein F2787_07040 [Actinobacteria bacterium]|uniref:Unannotated protein n=1 Tax=freshwater metagenome TaxID=449393 RepID=A0A6J7E2H7_9ZZZZ|nr:hypothetical protein [Actinomycetota bacterium]MSX25496.1 hypothetical protein [Actinomycetota bacterium]
MGFIANYKAKRAARQAQAVFEHRHMRWEQDSGIFKKINEAFTLASQGQDAAENNLVSKPGEFVLWHGQGLFHEAGKTPGHYEGGSQGFSMPIFGGIRYRVGAMRGTFIPGDEVQMDKDSGEVYITTERLIFNGGINSKEWDFNKWTGAQCDPTETSYLFHVSNRQKTAGLTFDSETGREFNRFLAQALQCAEGSPTTVLAELKDVAKDLAENEPKLEAFLQHS